MTISVTSVNRPIDMRLPGERECQLLSHIVVWPGGRLYLVSVTGENVIAAIVMGWD